MATEDEVVGEYAMIIDFLEDEIARLKKILQKKVEEMNEAVRNLDSDSSDSSTTKEDWIEDVPLCG